MSSVNKSPVTGSIPSTSMPEIYDKRLHFKHQKILKSDSDTTTSMSQYTEIPMLDMQELRSSSSSSHHHHHRGQPQQYAKEQLARACTEWGTFYVINHGIPEELIQSYHKLILQLFSLPLEQKLQAGRNKNSIFGYEFRQDKKNLIEVFQVGDHEAIIHHYSRKLFPNSYTQFCDALKELKEALCHLSLEILELVTEGLGMNMNNFDMYQREIQGLIRSNFYHQIDSHDEKEPVLGLKPHMDGSFISLLLQDDVAGLEIMKDGNWFCVKPKENAICIMIGDVLEVITNGYISSLQHRTIQPTMKPRLSLGYFLIPLDTCTISIAPEFVDAKNPPLFRPFSWLEYLELHRLLRAGLKGISRPNPSTLLFFKSLEH
ncbi:unnamed protein product [Sphagnum balticum]